LRPLCAMLVVAIAAVAGATENASIRDHILEGLEYSYREEYESARVRFTAAIQEAPDDPAGYFFLCGMYGLYMNDFSTDEVDGLFLINLFQTIWTAREILRADSSDAWAHFYLGGAYAYRAFREQQKGSKWSALSHALTAVDELKKTVSLDSTIYDAYMGIGSYHYFVNYLWSYIPFLGNNPERGIREMKLAMNEGRFVRVPAQEGLIHILLREKRREEAFRLASDLVLRYPNSRTFRWTLAKVYEDLKDWPAAAKEYRRLRRMIETGQPENLYNLAYCGHRLSHCLQESGEGEEAADLCRESLAFLEDVHGHGGVEELRRNLQALLSEIQKASSK
jgi:tetratricopeptide (TPR) repeat protein